MKHKMSEPGLRVSKLPEDIQAEVGRLNLDKDADGKINSAELRDMIVDCKSLFLFLYNIRIHNNSIYLSHMSDPHSHTHSLTYLPFLLCSFLFLLIIHIIVLSTKKNIKSLRKVTIVLAIYGIFLTFTIFGVSIAAARLAKDTTVDAATGNLQVKGSKYGQLIHTSPVSYDHQDFNIAALNNNELSGVTKIKLRDGDVEFAVKGFARSLINETVVIFVEGGSFVFDMIGLKNVTGDEITRLFSSFDEDMTSGDLDGRKLFFYREPGTIAWASTSSTCCGNPCRRAESTAAGPSPCTNYNVGRKGDVGRCGPSSRSSCPYDMPYCVIESGVCGSTIKHQNAQLSIEYNNCIPQRTRGNAL